jgi:MtrB/PioB family decaheme-associated outer membrane protein
MRNHTPLFLLAALGVLSVATGATAAVDTSEWKCQTCPYPKGTTGTVEVGVGAVSDASARFGDYTGLQKQGAHLVLGGAVNVRGDNGYFADLNGSDLGLDSRRLAARSGREGLYTLRLGVAEIPRHFADDAVTPFVGNGSSLLTLPAPASLQPVALGFERKRYDLGGSFLAGENWTYRVSLRRDTRDGTQGLSSSFFSSAAQLAAPVDQTTDQFELAAAYAGRRLQATFAYQLSQFRNGAPALTWDNPFAPVVAGATQGRLALAPDNRFEQITGSVGYDVTPAVRASADFAVGRMTQDAAYLASTANALLAPSVPALPANSLDGRVDTFSGNLRVSAAPFDGLRINAVLTRDVHDDHTAIHSFPQVATDIFVTQPRSNTPFSFWRDRLKLSAAYRGPGTLSLGAGVDQDNQHRRYSEVVSTRETTVWGRAGMRPRDDLGLSLKLAHGERNNSPYGVATWFGAPESPLLRKFNLADRQRDAVGARADLNVNDKLSLGLSADATNDDYAGSVVGLTHARSANLGADLSFTLSEKTQLHAFTQGEQVRSQQSGSQTGLAADWRAENKDRFTVFGLGVKHSAIADKLDLGADLTVSRSRSSVSVDTSSSDPPFPRATTALDSLKLYANYKLNDKTSITGSYWYEYYDAADWHLEGVLPTNVASLLTFGEQPPHYRVNLLRLALRYRF